MDDPKAINDKCFSDWLNLSPFKYFFLNFNFKGTILFAFGICSQKLVSLHCDAMIPPVDQQIKNT